MVPIYYRRRAQTDEKNNNNKNRLCKFYRKKRERGLVCVWRPTSIWIMYIYTRVSSSSNKANSPNRICTSFIYLLLFFFGNNHGRIRVRACMCNNMRRLPSLSRVGQWSGVQQVNKLDARARCWWSRRDGRRRRKKSIILSYYRRDVCVFFSSNYEDFEKMNTRSGVTCEHGEEAINRSVVARKHMGRWEGTMAWRRWETDIIIIL